MGMKMSRKDLADLIAKGAVLGPLAIIPPADAAPVKSGGGSPLKAKGAPRKVVGKMSAPERTYAEVLDGEVAAGRVLQWWYEAIQLRIADRTTYLVDFMVLKSDLSIEMVEIKGKHVWHASVVKFKAARELYPLFKFRMMQLDAKSRRWREMTVERKSAIE